MKTKKITVARGTFNVRDRENADGFPVVMLHGWPESSYCWEGVASDLDPNLRVIAPDLRGLGDSERTLDVKAYQKAELAKDVIEIIDALKIQDFFLVGHDWGGIVAQELAFLIPDRVKKFVILNIPILTNIKGAEEVTKAMIAIRYIPYWYQYFQMMPGLPEAMIKGKEREWVSFFFGKKGQDGTIPREAIDEYVRCYSIDNTPATAASYYRSMALDAPHWAGLAGKRFPMPSLYIYGNEDSVIIPANIMHLEDCFDSIKIEQVKAAHFLQEEKPREVAELMNRFFK
ncbi:MAG: alpha/beta hydrolase [Smithellaceae bacterium]|nr:alpha/beta hydrolase [Syntrophaceae bacterium]MDD4241560.1 alpha/beta hydrolase [Smithellaceae bacterium]